MVDWDMIGALGSVGAALVALVGVPMAIRQLSGVARSLHLDGLMAVLSLEAELRTRRERVEEAAANLAKHRGRGEGDGFETELLETLLRAAQESWLNTLERLCFCILRDYVPEKDWRAEYSSTLAFAAEQYGDMLQCDTEFTNIRKLHHQWSGIDRPVPRGARA